jgi:hypothetical protein
MLIHSSRGLTAAASAILISLALTPTRSLAVTIPAWASVGPPPGMTGTGLTARYYDQAITTTAAALAVVASSTPDAIFLSTLLDYPNGPVDSIDPGGPMSTFLGIDDPGIPDNCCGYVFAFDGLIEITSAFDTTPGGLIDVNFGLNSDDGSHLRIGGIAVIDNPGVHGFPLNADGVASFEEEGLYQFSILYYEGFLGAGFEVSTSIPGGPPYGRLAGIVPTAILYPVDVPEPTPEPSVGVLTVMGLLYLARPRTRPCRCPGSGSTQQPVVPHPS